jgi:hypothetical protein
LAGVAKKDLEIEVFNRAFPRAAPPQQEFARESHELTRIFEAPIASKQHSPTPSMGLFSLKDSELARLVTGRSLRFFIS